jgi:hypothetical protein
VPLRSPREAYPRRVREVELAHPLGTESNESVARRGRVGDEPGDVDRLAYRRKRAQTIDAFLEKDRGTVKVAAAPVVEADADLQDPVIQTAHRCGRVTPQQLERLVLLEELVRVELLDAAQKRFRRRLGAAGASGLVWCAGGLTFRRARGLTRAATGLGRARIR